MKGGKGKSKDASQWEPDDHLQAVSDIQDQHVCVRTSCVRWTSIVTSLIGVGKIVARKEHQICFAPMLTGSTVRTFHLQYEGWKGQKQRCIAMGSQMMTCRPFRIFKINMYVFSLSCVRWTSIVTSLIGVGKILARKEHQICFAPMLTGSTVRTFHLQYEGWKGQKQRCIAMGARWWLAGRFGYSRSTCMCSHLLRALKINSYFSNWWWKNCSKKRAFKFALHPCWQDLQSGPSIFNMKGGKGKKQRCIAMGARWWLAGRFGYSRSTCMCSHLLRALKINSYFSNWWWKF